MRDGRFEEHRMPTGPIYEERAKLFRRLQSDERYKTAKSCIHCTDTADSFNRYVSTYCHLRQEHIAGYEDKLDLCKCCSDYEKR